jgi:hypothetical protein
MKNIMIEFLSVIPNNVTKPIIAPTDKEPPRRIKIPLQGMSLLFRSCFSLWKLNQKDHKLCAAATVEPPQEEELARALPHSDPEPDGFADQLQHCTQSECPDNSLQSGNPGTLARRTAVGINSVLGERPKHRLPDHQRASSDCR